MNTLILFSALCAAVCVAFIVSFVHSENEGDSDSIGGFFKGIGVGTLLVLSIIGFSLVDRVNEKEKEEKYVLKTDESKTERIIILSDKEYEQDKNGNFIKK